MSSHSHARSRAQNPVRLAVMAATLAVIGCFSAAFTFAEQPAIAAEAAR